MCVRACAFICVSVCVGTCVCMFVCILCVFLSPVQSVASAVIKLSLLARPKIPIQIESSP